MHGSDEAPPAKVCAVRSPFVRLCSRATKRKRIPCRPPRKGKQNWVTENVQSAIECGDHSRRFAASYRCDRSSRTRSTRERRIINKLIKFFPSDLGLFQCPRQCAGQYKHRPEDGENDYSESNQLRGIVGPRSVGVSIGDETADAYRRGCCVFHGFNAPFMRSLKLTTICTGALRFKSNAVVTFRRTAG